MEWLGLGIRIGNWLAFALCAVKTAFLVFVVFVIPDVACFKWGVFDYATIALGLYMLAWFTFTVFASTTLRSHLFCVTFSVLGVASGFLIWELPQQRVECDGTRWPSPTVR
jgi:uncharacterized paraquat-inducible protein A